VYNSSSLASLAADDLWYGEFYSIFSVEFDGVSVDTLEKIIHSVWDNWRGSNFPVFDVQTCVF